MDGNRLGICAVILGAAAVVFYYTLNNTEGKTLPIPHYQTEAQLGGLNTHSTGAELGPNCPGAIAPELHFWAPGFPWAECDEVASPVPNRVRYPVVPGGNISTVMHKGWSQMSDAAPANYQWFLNPPEVAVL